MPKWVPEPQWQGEDAYIVGGGPSLRSFDWDLLRDRNTIGCNSAFLLGAHVIKILVFNDLNWWERIGRDALSEYGGIVVTTARQFQRHSLSWVRWMPREARGLHRDALGYNGNSGSLALNLALILGAQRVFLLGFDMQLGPDGSANWHTLRYESAKSEVYDRFLTGFRRVAADLPKVFPGREVVNVTDGSRLDVFPRVSLADHFQEVRA